MKRDFLKSLELSDDLINTIMAENGKDIEATKAKFSDYDDLKEQLNKANETLDKFKDYDETKAEVEKYKTELKKAQDESAQKIAKMERQAEINKFFSDKKFVNDETREYYFSKLDEEVSKEENKGKNYADIFGALTNNKTNILVEDNKPKAPIVAPMADNAKDTQSAVNKARAIMGLGPKAE